MIEATNEIIQNLKRYLNFKSFMGSKSILTKPITKKGDKLSSLLDVSLDIGDCRRCKLHKTRKNIVFGEGSVNSKLLFVGEAPGHDEDVEGRPFVGKAGQLLTKIINAMGFAREDVYIANVIKCRPPENRNPEPDEITACETFLKRQVSIIKPAVIIAMGKFAVQTLLKTEIPISTLRGTFKEYNGVKLMPTFHPAYLLRNPESKRLVWDDMKQVMRCLG